MLLATDTSVATLANAHAANHMNGPKKIAPYYVWTSLWAWAHRLRVESQRLETRLDVSSERVTADAECHLSLSGTGLASHFKAPSHQQGETSSVRLNLFKNQRIVLHKRFAKNESKWRFSCLSGPIGLNTVNQGCCFFCIHTGLCAGPGIQTWDEKPPCR